MKTTQQWLAEIKQSPEKLNHWLQRQYVGEALAAHRIAKLADTQRGTKFEAVLMKIARDELMHCEWVQSLLITRGIDLPDVTIEDTRYWEPILGQLHEFDEIAAAGHHAEAMRLVRIKALADDPEIDTDIRQVFTNILPDEDFHAKAFKAMSTPDALASTQPLHQRGLEILGLEI